MDKIRIYNLEVFGNHGLFPEENTLGQKFIVSAILYTDTRKAGTSDDLLKSIHYGDVCVMIDKFMKNHTYQLIETVAEQMASYLLIHVPNLERICLEVKKPWAPVGLPIETVSVEIERGWHVAYLGLGSNMGDRRKYLEDAVEKLDDNRGCRVVKVSDYMNTLPYGVLDQEEFLNGCVELKTLLTPEELLEKLHDIEREAGRERTEKWGPRTLDLDILLYDDAIVDTGELNVPHMDMQNRSFVLEPLIQIAPRKRHPLFNKTIIELNDELKRKTGR